MIAIAVAAALTHHGSSRAQDSIRLKNVLDTPITLLVQSSQKRVPTEIKFRAGDEFDYQVKFDGSYTLQVIPDDRPDTGYHLGKHDLRALSRYLNGRPLELSGDVRRFIDLRNNRIFDVRVAVCIDLPTEACGIKIRYSFPELNYTFGAVQGKMKPLNTEPTATSAVLKIVVPTCATVSVDGQDSLPTGELRVFETSPLTTTKSVMHKIKVEWEDDGHKCKYEREVTVRAGETTRVYFKQFAPAPVTTFDPAKMYFR
jgi:uncharacterized protein (TIGR03000 family)